ncbi:hypothetical protein [Paenibacillus sp. FSL W7-1287]|uniref:hypothetical protein n=1 Tax=Paenibacillus sp. FSL W7-1287 TaxID=2954538 RepID=UPI0030F911E7
MRLEEKLVQDFLKLTHEKQLEVIDFVEFLNRKNDQQIESLMDSIIHENKEALDELAK